MHFSSHRLLKNILTVILVTGGATGLRYLSNPAFGSRAPLLFHILAVAVAAQVAGTVTGLIVTGISVILIGHAIPASDIHAPAILAIFAAVAVIVSIFGGRQKRLKDELHQAYERIALKNAVARMGSYEWFVKQDRIEWSPELVEICGLETHSVSTIHTMDDWIALVHPEDRQEFAAGLRGSGQLTSDQSYRIIRPDGATRWVQSRRKYEYDDHQQPVYVMGVVIDITELKEAEEARRQTNAQFEALFDSIPEPTMVTDAEGKVVRVNDAFKRTFPPRSDVKGYIPDAKLFTEDGQLIPPEQWPINRLRRGEPLPATDLVSDVGGVRRNRRYSGTPVFDSSGKIRYAVLTMFDITDLKKGQVAQAILGGLLQVCSACRRIHDSQTEEWYSMEGYLRQHLPGKISHGMCPDCSRQWFPEGRTEPGGK